MDTYGHADAAEFSLQCSNMPLRPARVRPFTTSALV